MFVRQTYLLVAFSPFISCQLLVDGDHVLDGLGTFPELQGRLRLVFVDRRRRGADDDRGLGISSQ